MLEAINAADWHGHVHMETDRQGVVYDGPNLVLSQALELMVRALLGTERLSGIVFANSGGRQVTPGLRTIPGAIDFVDATGEIGTDGQGGRTLGTWRGVWTPPSAQVYDMVALVTGNRFVFAATAFNPVTLAANESVAVNWTILLRG